MSAPRARRSAATSCGLGARYPANGPGHSAGPMAGCCPDHGCRVAAVGGCTPVPLLCHVPLVSSRSISMCLIGGERPHRGMGSVAFPQYIGARAPGGWLHSRDQRHREPGRARGAPDHRRQVRRPRCGSSASPFTGLPSCHLQLLRRLSPQCPAQAEGGVPPARPRGDLPHDRRHLHALRPHEDGQCLGVGAAWPWCGAWRRSASP